PRCDSASRTEQPAPVRADLTPQALQARRIRALETVANPAALQRRGKLRKPGDDGIRVTASGTPPLPPHPGRSEGRDSLRRHKETLRRRAGRGRSEAYEFRVARNSSG